MACGRKNKILKMKKGTKSVSKYNTGVKQIAVPEVTENITTDTTSGVMQGAATGASLGSVAGPWGTVIGGVVGGIGGGLVGNIKGNEAKSQQMAEQDRIIDLNSRYKDLGIGLYNNDPKMQSQQQFAKGTKSIEIEAKEAPEIHTDKNFNLKNLGNNPHSNGGTKVQAQEGDIIFDTQNSKAKYQSVMNDIRRAKLGDRTAKRRLEKERDSLPDDTPSDGKMWDGNKKLGLNDLSTGVYEENKNVGFLANNEPNYKPTGSSLVDVNQTYTDINPFDYLNTGSKIDPNTLFTGNQELTENKNIGFLSPEQTAPREKAFVPSNENKGIGTFSNLVTNAGRFSSPLYKYMKSKENVSTPSEIPLNLQRLQYKDMSDVDRAEIDASRRAIDRQVNTSGLSRGQALGRLSQSAAQAARQKNAINQREQQIKQSIAQQNVNLTNQERQNLQQQQLRNQDIVRRAQGQKEAFLGEAMSDFSKLSEIESQKGYAKSRDKKLTDRDNKTLNLLKSEGYEINPDTWDVDFIDVIKNEKDPAKKEQLREIYYKFGKK